ncbi:hypothetical protein B0H14DRAFT_1184505 [Mycena olivaceomarginata]|nr:hypothetical protein B0H14DRAFT_1184505 [Mycena olivaceomarginata]
MACCGSLDSRTANRNAMSCRSRRRVADSSWIGSDSRSAMRAASMRWARVYPALSSLSATLERICFKTPLLQTRAPLAVLLLCCGCASPFWCRRCRVYRRQGHSRRGRVHRYRVPCGKHSSTSSAPPPSQSGALEPEATRCAGVPPHLLAHIHPACGLR